MPMPRNMRAYAAYEARQSRDQWKRRRTEPTPEDLLPRMGTQGNCWCGEELGHDWPDKAEGAPHPREEKRPS